MPPLDSARRSAGLSELLEKYDLLLKLSAGEPGRTIARRDALRAVAARFPGALREWDQLPQAELERRRAYIAALLSMTPASALATSELPGFETIALTTAEPWLRYTLELHEGLRALLSHRRTQREKGRMGQRLSEEVYAAIAARHGVSVLDVKRAVYSVAPPTPVR